MRAGGLRHRVAIMRPTATVDDMGQPVPTLAEVATVWASVEPLTGRELLLAQQVRAETTHKVTLRGGADVRADDVLLFGTRRLAVESVRDIDERGREVVLACQETG